MQSGAIASSKVSESSPLPLADQTTTLRSAFSRVSHRSALHVLQHLSSARRGLATHSRRSQSGGSPGIFDCVESVQTSRRAGSLRGRDFYEHQPGSNLLSEMAEYEALQEDQRSACKIIVILRAGRGASMSTDKNEWMRDFKYARSFMLPILLATCDQLTYLCLSILPVEGGQSILDGVASLTSLLHLVMHNDIFNQLETFVITMDTALACVASLPKLQELALYNITGDVSTSSALQYTGQVQRLSLHGVDDLTDTGLRAMLLGLAPAATGLQISSCADLTPGLLHVVSVVGRTLLDLLLLCCDNGTLSVTDRAIQDSGFASMRVLRCAIIKGNCITGEGLSKAPASLLDLRVEASDNVTAAWLCLWACSRKRGRARLRIARADWLWIDIKAILVRDIASKQLPCSLICSAS